MSLAPLEEPPYELDAMVIEEDTHLLLSTESTSMSVKEELGALVHAAESAPPLDLGTAVLRGSHPTRLLAIVPRP